MTDRCRLCGEAAPLWCRADDGRPYDRCARCGAVQVSREHLPDAAVERARYDLHQNDPEEPGYRRFITTFLDAVDAAIAAQSAPVGGAATPVRILDYGSGPLSALEHIARSRGWRVASWDPLYSTGDDPLDSGAPWDVVMLHEVIEHVHEPGRLVARIANALHPQGLLAIRTAEPPTRADLFLEWWYRKDVTHVWFVSEAAVAWIERQLGATHRRYGEGIWMLHRPSSPPQTT